MDSKNEYMTNLYKKYTVEDKASVIGLLNFRGDLVAAIYVNLLKCDDLSILNLADGGKYKEKYFIVIDGLAIYFTSFKKLK